ncbi:Ig-like domain-containing protein [Blautia wexlerae]|uniref:Ig-like domain-containing protein n=1 Tax=Blautia wexlerae TaxID=418240 RepID=UPI001570D567|nr:Ig-like domain-containing protein [Blautia wexlerae]NSF41391.1 Ig-like domain-containing protein [Blautia wexlerae]
MKRMKKFIGILLFVLTFGLASTITIPQIGTCVDVQAATVSLNRRSTSVYIGKTTQLKVNNYTGKIRWSSSNTSIATVSSTGKVKGKKAGTVTISARAGKKTLKCKVTVRSVISVSPKEIYLDGTDDATITVKLKHRCGLRYSITSPYVVSCSWDKQWYENNTVAYLYITGERTGTTYVTITNTFNNEKVRIKVVVDTTVKVEGVNISSNSESLYVGDSVKLSADVYPSNATDRGITWYSDNTSVAKVSDYGRVEAVSSGQATITAKSNNGHTASCIITVMTPINVKLPNTPVTIKSYDYGGGLRRACIITNVRFECGIKVSDSYSCRIYIDGKKTYDFGGNTISSPCPIGYKIYRNGAVIKSGVIYSTALGVGESFIDCSGNLFLAPGNYELQLLDVR